MLRLVRIHIYDSVTVYENAAVCCDVYIAKNNIEGCTFTWGVKCIMKPFQEIGLTVARKKLPVNLKDEVDRRNRKRRVRAENIGYLV